MACLSKIFRRQENNQTVANSDSIKITIWLNPTRYGGKPPDSSNFCFKFS